MYIPRKIYSLCSELNVHFHLLSIVFLFFEREKEFLKLVTIFFLLSVDRISSYDRPVAFLLRVLAVIYIQSHLSSSLAHSTLQSSSGRLS